MQLQMTAPLEIGLEQQDQSLGLGQDDIFDLEDTERRLNKNGGIESLMDGAVDDESEEEEDNVEDAEMLDEDEEEERERKVRALEQDLDGLYESYQERLRERDAKYRVKEARRKDKSREEWGGIQKGSSDEDDESEKEGGWDTLQATKSRVDEDSDSSDEDSDEAETEAPQPSKKRRRPEEVVDLTKNTKKARTNGSITLNGNSDTVLSRSTQVWFSQDLFKSAGIDDVEDDDDDETMENEEEDADADVDVDVAMDGASGSESQFTDEEVCSVDIQDIPHPFIDTP